MAATGGASPLLLPAPTPFCWSFVPLDGGVTDVVVVVDVAVVADAAVVADDLAESQGSCYDQDHAIKFQPDGRSPQWDDYVDRLPWWDKP